VEFRKWRPESVRIVIQSMIPPSDQQGVRPVDNAADVAGWLEQILACPVCRTPVGRDDSVYACASCGRAFPIRRGIPDFRLAPDPYISIEAEVAKIDKLFAGPSKSFRELLAAYYELSPENPPSLNRHYVGAMGVAVRRGRGILRRLLGFFPDTRRETLLDLGCGTGGLLGASLEMFERSVGVDVALRWLLIGRQRLDELGVRVPLVCANAESLPFMPGIFDAVVGEALLEHVRDPAATRDETLRVLRPGAAFMFTTNNRFSILPEPHLRIAGFGLLPRRTMERVAWMLRRTPYRARLLSLRELTALFRKRARIFLPSYEAGELGERYERLRRLWERAGKWAIVRAVVWPIAPQYFVAGRKPSLRSDDGSRLP
jgi:SAM-dependent methyltransferase